MNYSELHKMILIKFMIRPDQDVFPTGCSSVAGHPGRGTPALGRVQVFLVMIIMTMIMIKIPQVLDTDIFLVIIMIEIPQVL